MLAIWSLIPLPFLKPAWTYESSWFTYCWSLAWRIISITLLAWDEHNCAVVWAFFGIALLWDWNENCGHCWVFQICWHINPGFQATCSRLVSPHVTASHTPLPSSHHLRAVSTCYEPDPGALALDVQRLKGRTLASFCLFLFPSTDTKLPIPQLIFHTYVSKEPRFKTFKIK